MRRLLITAMSSGGGKTILTCGLMRAYARRGLRVSGFKCGPDYIDPMFHTRVLGVPSRNLDLFLQGEDGIRRTLTRQEGDLAILEGAMGYYDGVGGTAEASAWQVSSVTDTPALLAVRSAGQSLTLAAQIRGLLEFRRPSRIAGLFLMDCAPSLYSHLRPILERETGLPVLGYLPHMKEAELQSRHLGLVTASEIEDLSARIDAVADALERYADLDGILSLSAETVDITRKEELPEPRCRIAVARDEAFSFYYADNLDALREAGAELVFFSPLWDRELPEADGLYLGGGYPELYLQLLSDNVSMRRSVHDAVAGGLPTVAECGGFLYLQKEIRDRDGKIWPMAGVLPGTGFPTDRLQRFGYLTVLPEEDSLLFRRGEEVPAHEFHYWDCTVCGDDLTARKSGGRTWRFGSVGKTLYAAFPHLHWGGSIPMAKRLADAAAKVREGKK